MNINHGAAGLWMLLGLLGNAGAETLAFNSSLAPFLTVPLDYDNSYANHR